MSQANGGGGDKEPSSSRRPPSHHGDNNEDDDDDNVDGLRQHLPRRASSLSLPEEELFGVSPPGPPQDCDKCMQHHHRHHHHHHHHHHQAPPPLASPTGSSTTSGSPRGHLSLPSSPVQSGPTIGLPLASPSSSSLNPAAAAAGAAGGGGGGLPPRLPLQQRQSSIIPHPPPDLMAAAAAANSSAGGSGSSLPSPGGAAQGASMPPLPPHYLQFAPHQVVSPVSYSIPQSPSGIVITKPHRIILVRHGESTGNVDEKVYETTPDWKVPLSPKGQEQAWELGRQLKEIIGNEPIYVYTSPYLRTKQTLAGILESFEDNLKVGIREEPRITEQQFGNLQCHEEMQAFKRHRAKFGRFYYRFPNGESGLDVYTRVTSFISTMFRDFADGHICRPDLNVVIVTHGLTLRLLLMRWFKLTVDTFESTTNPPNASFVVMSRKETGGPQVQGRSGGGVYELAPESAALISLSYNAVPVGQSLKTPTSGGGDSVIGTATAAAAGGGNGGKKEEGAGGEKEERGVAKLSATLKDVELEPSLSLSAGSASGGNGGSK